MDRRHCWHCGLPLFDNPEQCPRCGAPFDRPEAARANFDPLTGEDRYPDPAPAATPDAGQPEPLAVASPDREPARWNLIARHWRGDLPLAVSFWLFGVLFNVAFYLATPYVIDALPPPTSPGVVFLWTAVAWIGIVTVTTWQAVGIWRSASRRRRLRWQAGQGAFWSIAARLWAGLVVLGGIQTLVIEGSWQVTTGVEIAFLGDPDMPPLAISIDAENRAIVIEGGVKFGLAEALEEALAEAPDTEVVVLESPGGRVGAAAAVMDVIRAHGLSTYSNGQCASACTLIFAAGRERVLGPGGLLGYHAASSGYRFDPQIADDPFYEGLLRDAGIDPDFVERATASIRFTVPGEDELFAIGAITSAEARPRLYLGTEWRRL